VSDLFTYWNDYPPTHVLVGGYLLANRKRGSAKHAGGSLDELKASVISAGGSVKKEVPAIHRARR
jgi:hypothetical protein